MDPRASLVKTPKFLGFVNGNSILSPLRP